MSQSPSDPVDDDDEQSTPDGATDGEADGESDSLGPDEGCCVPAGEMLAVRDLNKKPPWKCGNQYRTVCPECNATQFASKEYWKHAEVQYVIPRGEAGPVVLYDCPYEDCDGQLKGEMEECPECEQEILWED